MRITKSEFFNYVSEKTVSQQVENDIRIITKRGKKKNKTNTATHVASQKTKDSYEQAMDTSKYDQILSELTV